MLSYTSLYIRAALRRMSFSYRVRLCTRCILRENSANSIVFFELCVFHIFHHVFQLLFLSLTLCLSLCQCECECCVILFLFFFSILIISICVVCVCVSVVLQRSLFIAYEFAHIRMINISKISFTRRCRAWMNHLLHSSYVCLCLSVYECVFRFMLYPIQ